MLLVMIRFHARRANTGRIRSREYPFLTPSFERNPRTRTRNIVTKTRVLGAAVKISWS